MATDDNRMRTWWSNHGLMVMRIAVVFMAAVAIAWLGYESWRLLWQSGKLGPDQTPMGGIDLWLRHMEVRFWFSGFPVYRELKNAIYPPASYALLWPLVGWLELRSATVFWAISTAAALGWLVWLVVKESGAKTRLERTFAALIPLSMYATGATIGNGQLIIHLLPMVVGGLLLLRRARRAWHEDLLAAMLLMATLVKPNVAIPFFLLLLLVPGSLRPAMFAILGYAVLTLLAASFQEAGLVSLLRNWLEVGSRIAVLDGTADLHTWLAAMDLQAWILPASFLLLLALGVWIYIHRSRDIWLLLGVTAIATRFWTYHRWYDDLLILLPMVALFRLARKGGDVLAGVLLGFTMVMSLAPGGLYLLPPPWNEVYVGCQTVCWTAVLMFLLISASRR